jgi:hypothetical protein
VRKLCATKFNHFRKDKMMRITMMFTILVFGLMICLPNLGSAAPMGTAWSYQGRLMDAGVPADGLYDFQFRLFDDPCTGTQQGSTIDVNDIDVFDGHFTIELDFGADTFDGSARWLQVEIRPGTSTEPNDYVTLSPLQKLIPVPYSLHAKTVSAPLQLIAEGSPGTAVLSVGSTVEGVAVGASSPDGDIAVLGKNGTAIWGISPNGYGGFFNGKGYFSGDVGIGTDTPMEMLHIMDGGDWASMLLGGSEGGGFIGFNAFFDEGNWNTVNTENDGAFIRSKVSADDPRTQLQIGFVDHNDANTNQVMVIRKDGNVGIGTNTPEAKLHVYGNSPDWQAGGIFIENDAFGDRQFSLYHTPENHLRIGDETAEMSRLEIDENGNVGIGTTTPVAKLTVAGAILRDGSTMYGSEANTHTNLGTNSTTGRDGFNSLYATICGGFGHTATGYAFIGGGIQNHASGASATVVGGDGNHGNGYCASIVGGRYNKADGSWSTVGGGNQNTANDNHSTVGGGSDNTASGWSATVGGGYNNTASGYRSVVPGGENNEAVGDYSFAAGRQALANHDGTFVWADSNGADFTSTSDYQFLIRASGGVGIGTASPSEKLDVDGTARLRGISAQVGSTYVHVDSNGKLWKIVSSKKYKSNIKDLEDDPYKVLQLRPVKYQSKTTGQQDVGLISEEVHEVLTDLVIYDNEGNPDAVKYDRISLFLLGIVKSQQKRIESLEQRLGALENTTQQLIKGKEFEL